MTPPEDLATLFGHTEATAAPEATDRLAAAAREVLRLRRDKDTAEAALKEANSRLERAEDVFLEAARDSGALSVRVVDEYGRAAMVTASQSTRYSVPVGTLDDNSFMTWLLKQGGGDIVKRNCHHATFSSFCRELVEAGKFLHPRVNTVTQKVVRVSRD